MFVVDVDPVMSVDTLKDIIAAFLQRNVKELSDQELNTTIAQAGKICTIQEIQQTVQSIGSSLFRCSCSRDGTYSVQIEPKVNGFDRIGYWWFICHFRSIYARTFFVVNVLRNEKDVISVIFVSI